MDYRIGVTIFNESEQLLLLNISAAQNNQIIQG